MYSPSTGVVLAQLGSGRWSSMLAKLILAHHPVALDHVGQLAGDVGRVNTSRSTKSSVRFGSDATPRCSDGRKTTDPVPGPLTAVGQGRQGELAQRPV